LIVRSDIADDIVTRKHQRRGHEKIRPARRIGGIQTRSILQRVGSIWKRVEVDIHVSAVNFNVINTMVGGRATCDTDKYYASAKRYSF